MISYKITKSDRVVLKGQIEKNLKTNKQVLDIARKALNEKLKIKKGLHRITIFRGDKVAGEWTCHPIVKSA